MKSLLTIFLLLGYLSVFAQLQNISVSSSGGSVSSNGELQSVIVVGDPAASSDIGVAGALELYSGFLAANFLGVEASDSISVQDSLALVQLYQEAGGVSWANNAGWLVESVPNWFGVGVEGDRVVSIDLPANNLTGFLTDSVINLSALVNLNLSGNQLARDIPSGLGVMESLRFVDLSNNQLEGAIPDSLGLATNLLRLNLANNELNGGFPVSLTSMRALRQLNISGNQLKGPLPDSIGKMSAIVEFDISGNLMEGSLPASLNELSRIKVFRISDNQFSGPVPTLNSWTTLKEFDISNNQLQGALQFLLVSDSLSSILISQNEFRDFPDLSTRSGMLDSVNVSFNQLDFGDLEPNRNLSSFAFSPQDSVGVFRDTLVQRDANVLLGYNIGGSLNFYQWIKDGAEIDGETFDSYNIPAARSEDAGQYVLRVGNDNFTDFFLYTKPVEVVVSSLERDSLSLVALYNQTSGEGWNRNDGWLSGNLSAGEWQGVLLNSEGTGVTGIILEDNNLTGQVPRDIRFIANLDSLDLSGNEITRFPDISRYDLSYLDLAWNRLSFADLYPNRLAVAERQDFIYDSMKVARSQNVDTIFVPAGNDFELLADIPGRANRYQWIFDDFDDPADNQVALPEGNRPFYVIEDINYDKMGQYFVRVTNDSLPRLTLEALSRQIFAVDDVFGTVFNKDGSALVTSGQVDIYRITRSGRYRFVRSSTINETGSYVLENILLGDFILRATPGEAFEERYIQTYYEDANDWQDADSLNIRSKVEGVDIFVLDNPGASVGEGTAEAKGIVEAEFADDGSARIDARRRVRKAACSLRRSSRGGGGRTDQDPADFTELVAYVESDENGEFSFANIPPDLYLLNIQFPGVPMDETTDLFLEVPEDREDTEFSINALITDEGVQVEIETVLGTLKPYISNAVLYPNPTDGKFRMDYHVDRKLSGLSAILIDMRGVVVRDIPLSSARGGQEMEMDISDLESGIYLLQLKSDEEEFEFSTRIYKK